MGLFDDLKTDDSIRIVCASEFCGRNVYEKIIRKLLLKCGRIDTRRFQRDISCGLKDCKSIMVDSGALSFFPIDVLYCLKKGMA